jgi:hypothetical protein
MNELYPIIRRQRRPLSGTPVAKPVLPVDVCPHCGRSLTSVTLDPTLPATVPVVTPQEPAAMPVKISKAKKSA